MPRMIELSFECRLTAFSPVHVPNPVVAIWLLSFCVVVRHRSQESGNNLMPIIGTSPKTLCLRYGPPGME